jgi:Uma2 family endonuclease
MVAKSLPKLVTFEEFLLWKPEGKLYELHEGIIIEMQPTGKHEEIIGFLATEFTLEYRKLKLPYFIPKTALVKIQERNSGYSPDILILDRATLKDELLWEKYSTVQKAISIPLIVEVVSNNWRDDYLTKLRDYEEIGVKEYWIIDYLALGGRRYIGNPKQPTISIYQLVDGEYQVNQFREQEQVQSLIFPEIKLTAEEILQVATN